MDSWSLLADGQVYPNSEESCFVRLDCQMAAVNRLGAGKFRQNTGCVDPDSDDLACYNAALKRLQSKGLVSFEANPDDNENYQHSPSQTGSTQMSL